MYKCRLCGETYAKLHNVPNRQLALSDLENLLQGNPLENFLCPIFHDVHTCDRGGYEGSMAVADFIGWKAKMIEV